MKQTSLEPVYCETIPDELEEGKLYISEKFKVAIHRCCCGCKRHAVTPFYNDGKGWTITKSGDKVTLRPSIGNFIGENPYHAHYYITNNIVQWL
jgi:hypothetical protein